jgi:hypothetical protein
MFEKHIELAQDFNRRHEKELELKRQGLNVPEEYLVAYTELTAWQETAENLISQTFGARSNELAEYKKINQPNQYWNELEKVDPDNYILKGYMARNQKLILFLRGLEVRYSLSKGLPAAKSPTPTDLSPSNLREMLVARFNEEELRDLCFDLSVDYESLVGQGKAGKARELISYM